MAQLAVLFCAAAFFTGCVVMPPIYPGRVLASHQMQIGYGIQWNQESIVQDKLSSDGKVYHSSPQSQYMGYVIDLRIGEPFGLKYWEVDLSNSSLLGVAVRRQWLNPGKIDRWASAVGLEGGWEAVGGRWMTAGTLALSSPLAKLNADAGLRLGYQQGPDFETAAENHWGDDYRSAWYPPASAFVDAYGGLRWQLVQSDLSMGAWARWQQPTAVNYVHYGQQVNETYAPVFGIVVRMAWGPGSGATLGLQKNESSLPSPGPSPVQRNSAGHLSLGRDLRLGKFYADAASEFNAALSMEPANTEALKGLGYCYLALGDRKQAMEYYRRALQADPADKALKNWMDQMEAAPPGGSQPSVPN